MTPAGLLRRVDGAGRIYVADGEAGLVMLPTLPNAHLTVRVDATPGVISPATSSAAWA